MATTALDCERLRSERTAAREQLDELRAEIDLSDDIGAARSVIARLAGALRSFATLAGNAAARADRLLQAAKLLAAGLTDLLQRTRGENPTELAADHPEKGAVDAVEDVIAAIGSAVDRVEQAFVVAEGSPAARLAAVGTFVGDLRDALARLDRVPGLGAFLDDAGRALDALAQWSERLQKVRRSRGGEHSSIPGIGLDLWPSDGSDEPAAREQELALRVARLDVELLACGDRPAGPPCIDCGEHDADAGLGDVLRDAGIAAKEKATGLARETADLVSCRTALRQRRQLDEAIRETWWQLEEAVRRGHHRKEERLRQDLDKLRRDRRRLQRLMPAHALRYREAATAYRDAATSWRDATAERLHDVALEHAWGTAEQDHLRDCHPDVPPPLVAVPPVDAIAPHPPARRRAYLSLAAAGLIAVVLAGILILGGGGNDEKVEVVAPGTTKRTTTSVAPGVNAAPTVGAITATFEFPVTTYEVEATDPDGDSLRYRWTKEGHRECGEFTVAGPIARWSHPHPPCPEESFHPSVVTVTVTDGEGHTVVAVYEDGSEPGEGKAPPG